MLRRWLFTTALFAFCVLIAGPSVPKSAIAGVDFVVGDGDACPPPLVPGYATIHEALAAANVNDTIFVCQGTYDEPTLTIDKSGLLLLGPGSTPADDGVATITKATSSSSTVLITAAGTTFSGFTVDATPPTVSRPAVNGHS